ncbi:hypothetical protein PFTANZ_01738 [Plasmodium falciparum Tanzania (2000708)]|uniref:Uncharacterized protein n=1 Tax=Plasmodium falciparum Tanzania (2000708) TaxID=1036725 RepID=A0A024WA09_PLAFA|nr:hypothetical protein PFTANZ_01738 [Plasmodium falciparum Tanzania (2000708)]
MIFFFFFLKNLIVYIKKYESTKLCMYKKLKNHNLYSKN